MKRKTNDEISPREAARQLRHLLYGQDTGVVMATTAFHKSGDISRKNPSPAAFHAEKANHYIGQFLEGFGLCDVQFPKSGCRRLTREEVETLKKVRRAVGPFPA